MYRHWTRIAAALAHGVLVVLIVTSAGCGGGDEGGPSTPANVTPAPATPGSPSSTLDLATTAADLMVFGGDADDYLADRFSLAHGDFNADGIDDLLVGAPKADGPDNARSNAGEAYVIFGFSDIRGTVDMAEGQQDFTVIGANEGDNLGFVVTSGDVNGDDIDDILVGARFASGPAADRNNVGKVYVILGSPDLSGTVDTALDEQDFTVVGGEKDDYLGYALAAGDVNGDDVDDIIVGAPGADGPEGKRVDAGKIYVVFGSPNLSGTVDVAQNQQDFTIIGAKATDFLPNFAASGDVNSDGIDDILVGTQFADGPDGQRADTGVAYVIFGSPEPKGTLDLATGEGFLAIWGADVSDWLGFVLTAADVNGDKVDDILVGARNADGPGNSRNNCGEVYILFGTEDLPSTVDIADGKHDVTLIGSAPNSLFGHSLASGDVNGDDIADVLMGGPVANSRQGAGQILVFLSPGQWPATVDAALGQHNLTILGAEAEDELGFSLASGDINGDGIDDMIGGALLADGPDNARPDAGEVYVIFGAP